MTWERKALRHLGRVMVSNVDKHSVDGQPTVRLCNYTDVYKNETIHDAMSFMVATASSQQSKQFRIRPGDTVITKDSETADDIGVPTFVESAGEDLVCGYHLAIVRPDSEVVDPKFLVWAMRSRLVRTQWAVLATGVTRVGLKQVDMRSVKIDLPIDLVEQRAIAKYLDRETAQIDALIEKQHALIERLEERQEATIRVATRAGGGSGFDGWDRLPIRRLGRLVTGTTPVGESGDVYESSGVRGWVTPEDLQSVVKPTRFLTEFGWSQMRPIPAGSALVCCIGATVGKVGWTVQELASNQQITALAPRRKIVGRYLYFALRGERAQIVQRSVGNTIPILNNRRLAEVEVSVPDIWEQRAIVAHLDRELANSDTLIAKAQRFIEVAVERRAALITAAVTGQIDIVQKAVA